VEIRNFEAGIMVKEDRAEEQQGRRAHRPGDLEEDAGVVDGADGADADDVDDRGDGHRDGREQHDVPVCGRGPDIAGEHGGQGDVVAAVPAMKASNAV
jgi:hypothetical protein